MLAAYRLLRDRKPVRGHIAKVARWPGTTTFPMYAIHYPALCLFAAMSPFVRSSWANVLFVTCGVTWVVILITPVCEWTKCGLRRLAESVKALGQARDYQLP